MPIPDFNADLILPSYLGTKDEKRPLSPYECSTRELCDKLGTTTERRKLLTWLLDVRERIVKESRGTTGFQLIGGSFLEQIEVLENRPPRDLDIVTVFGFGQTPEQAPERNSPEAGLINVSGAASPKVLRSIIFWTQEWIQRLSHTRDGRWRGMLKIELNTPLDDARARMILAATSARTPGQGILERQSASR
jgi:uncharacterized protein DUF6932